MRGSQQELTINHQRVALSGRCFVPVVGASDMKLAVIGLGKTPLMLLFGQRLSEDRLSV